MVETFGGLHVLINVAGVGRAARFEEIDEREWERTLAVNLTGVFHTTKAALPHLLQQRGSATSSTSRRSPVCAARRTAAPTAPRRPGMINFTRSLALEFASRDLRANCVAPAGIQTDLISHFMPREDFEPQLIAYYSPPKPGKLWKPEDIAKSIAFLASDDARMINGAVLVCDGGTLA